MSKTISLIIPVYNTAIEYVKRLLDGVFHQECIDSVQVILVDDGSEETNVQALKDLVDRDYQDAVLLCCPHGGVSAARNQGIEAATGEYIAFADADDEISGTFFKDAGDYIKGYRPDIVFGVIEFIPDQRFSVQSSGVVEQYFDMDEVKKSFFNFNPRKASYTIVGSPCARIYRTELVKKTMFQKGLALAEDQVFNREMLNVSENVLVVPDVWYKYYQYDNSSIHTFREKTLHDIRKFWDATYSLDQKENSLFSNRLRIKAVGFYYNTIEKYFSRSEENRKWILNQMKELAEHPLIVDACKNLSVFSKELSLSQRIVLFLVCSHMYGLLLTLARIRAKK